MLILILFLVQAEVYNLNRSDWSIDKASDQRMVYVPKDTVIEFMKKVGYLKLNAQFNRDIFRTWSDCDCRLLNNRF